MTRRFVKYEYDEFMDQYNEDHKLCPKCGCEHAMQTMVGYVLNLGDKESYKDLNKSTCQNCGDIHMVHDRVKNRNENMKENKLNLPEKDGWYWILIDGYNSWTPCWYMEQSRCFLPAGLGDSSSMGVYLDEIKKIGPEIIEPEM